MKTMMIAAVAALSLSASADVFKYVDHWPSGTGDETSTEVLVTNVTAAIATAEDVTRVARLTKLEIASDATVTYTASDALALSAAVSGKGLFKALSSGTLTISGDNAALVSPGHFDFTNSPVIVSHPSGLGARNTGAAIVYFDTKSTLDFVCNESGVFTNEAPLHVNSRPGSGKLRIGVSPRTGRLVQHNGFRHLLGSNSGDNTVRIDGTLEFLDCNIAVTWKFLYFGASGGTSHLWFTGNCTYNESYATFMYDAQLKIHFNGTSNFGAGQVLTSNGYCEGVDVLKDAYIMPWQSSMILDLQGYDQRVLRFENAYGNASAKRCVHSDRAAVLTTTGNTDITHSLVFTGGAGYCHSNTATEVIQNYVSTSTNLLDIAKGKVIFKSGAGWNGDAVVRSGATLELDSVCAMTNKVRALSVETGGKLVIRNGALCTLKSITLAGTALDEGTTYTVSQLRDTMGLPVDGDDSGAITVVGSATWGGWPTTPGARAFVPMGQTALATDDDVAKLAVLGEIYISPDARVVLANASEKLVLNARVTGLGTFEVRDSAGVVLAGDNSCLYSPGAFYFTNSYVVVSNRYGLGSSLTDMATYYYGDCVDSLRFGGEGLTNDVAIWCYPGTKEGCFVIGPDNADEDLVFNNSFRFRGGGGNNTLFFRNRVHFRGGIFGTVNSDGAAYNHIYSNRKGTYAEVWFEGDVKMHFYFWFAADITYHLDWAGIDWAYLFQLYTGNARAICYRPDLFKPLNTGFGLTANSQYLDLNGYDQTLPSLTKQYTWPNVPIVVTSAVPAAVIKTKSTTDGNCCNTPAKFRGAAGYTHAAACTNDFYQFYSDTVGSLTVEKGALRLRDGAGWGGTNVTVRAGAALIVASTSATNTFRTANTPSRTHLAVESGGTLRLESSVKPVQVKSFTYDGVAQKPGAYTAADNVGLEGPGTLNVRRYPWDRGMLLLIR